MSPISESPGALLWTFLPLPAAVRLGDLLTAPAVALISLLVSDPFFLLPSAPVVLGGCFGGGNSGTNSLPSFDLTG